MALIKGSLIAEASGKMGGVVFARNSGGQYVRNFRVPTNPNTTLQQARRNAFGQASIRWRDVLTPAQRAAWDAIAPTITASNALGDPITLNGQQAYVRAASVAAILGITDPVTAPGDTGETPLGTLEIDTVATNQLDMILTGAPAWAANANGRLLMYLGRQVSAATNFYRGPFQYRAAQAGNATPVVGPTFTLDPAITSGGRYFVRFQAYLEGRLSQEFKTPIDVP